MSMGSETAMTRTLQDAFEEAERPPKAEQVPLADEALAERRSGRTLPFDPDEQ
jgi:hypothetical protein